MAPLHCNTKLNHQITRSILLWLDKFPAELSKNESHNFM